MTAATDSGAAAKAVPNPAVLRPGKAPAFQPDVFKVPAAIEVPGNIPRPSHASSPEGHPRPLLPEEYGECKDTGAIERMRRAGQLAARARDLACEVAKEGVTTSEVDRVVSEFIVSQGGYPVGIRYFGFPRAICASVNEVALHGIPDTRRLEAGDIVNFDVVAYIDGAYGDCSAMACIGDVDPDARRLVDTTRECLEGAIAIVRPGLFLNEIGKFCSEFSKARGFGIVGDYCGHFIGSELHMKPNVLHVPNANQLELRPGMTFTIEPILVEGSGEVERPAEDGWTILSKNRGWSAQWEHTVLVTDQGVEILTVSGSE